MNLKFVFRRSENTLMVTINSLSDAVALVGGPSSAAEACGRSTRAIYKWLSKGALPRTEYSGETNYAKCLADRAEGKFTADRLLEVANPAQPD